MITRKHLLLAIAATSLLTMFLITIMPGRSPNAGEYDPWLDWNDDGKINLIDVFRAQLAFGTTGQPLSKAGLAYDSGWINITDKCGQYFNITHNLNSMDLTIDVVGKTTPDGGIHQKHYGLTNYEQGWSKTYQGLYERSAVQTKDGGYAMVGLATGGSSGILLIKTDADGDMQWNQTYTALGGNDVYAMIQTADGGYALAGDTGSYGPGTWNFWLIKTDLYGNAQWNQTYARSTYNIAYSLIQTSDGGYALAGYCNPGPAGGLDMYLVKTFPNGTKQWERTMGPPGPTDEVAYSVVQTNDGGYALAGYTTNVAPAYSKFWLVKTDSIGVYLWSNVFGGSTSHSQSHAYSIVQTQPDNGYAILGYTNATGAGSEDFYLVKTDVNGVVLWDHTYGGSSSDGGHALVQTKEGGYALVGNTYSFGAGDTDYWLVKTDAYGNAQWNQTYGSLGADQPWSMVQTKGEGFTLAGYQGIYYTTLVKTDTESGLAWVNSTANDITLYRGATDPYWNFVRVQIWQRR
jgi:hypothetical protein